MKTDLPKSFFEELVDRELKRIDYPASLKEAQEFGITGMTHYMLSLKLSNGEEGVLRWMPPGVHPNPARRGDSYFGGIRSVEREATLLNLAVEIGLPATPVITYGKNEEEGQWLIVGKAPGVNLRQFVDGKDFQAYEASLISLAKNFARAHSYQFPRFGSIQANREIIPSDASFLTYLNKVLKRHFKDNLLESMLSPTEIMEIHDFFSNSLNKASEDGTPAGFVLYDQHPGNIHVNAETGQVTGLFDIEYGQAAHPVLEMGSVDFQLLGLYENHVPDAEEVFIKAYTDAGGSENILRADLRHVVAANHVLSAVKSYMHFRGTDNLRQNWSQRFAQLTLEIARTGQIPYRKFKEITAPVLRRY